MKPPAEPPGASRPARLRLHRERFPGRSPFDTAISHAMLRRVAAGAAPESLRLYAPDNAVLFSSLDARRPGFARARALAREAGFDAVLRLAGGHAALFLEESMAFAWAIPDVDAPLHIRPRFERLSGLLVRALRRLGLDARVGEVPGEYCPGEFSVNLAGRIKVMGVGQRVIRGGAHVGGVLTIGQTQLMREVLIPIYDALELEFQPETAGGIADVEPGLTVEDVVASLIAVLADEGIEIATVGFEPALLEAAESLAPMHSADRAAAGASGSLRSADAKTLLHADRAAERVGGDAAPDEPLPSSERNE